MPIRFRCSYCNRLLGIATRKAGTQTRCPHCGHEITVPAPETEARTEHLTADGLPPLLGRGATELLSEPAVATAPPVEKRRLEPARAPAPSAPQPGAVGDKPKAASPPPVKDGATQPGPDERPLFEADIDEIFGQSVAQPAPERVKPPAAPGVDALSLGDTPRHIVVSAGTATLLMVVVVILLALAFAAGYFLSPKG
jgi:phage FluMu protein Com